MRKLDGTATENRIEKKLLTGLVSRQTLDHLYSMSDSVSCTGVLIAANSGSVAAVRVEETRKRDNNVRGDEQTTFQVVTPAVENQEIDDQHCHKQRYRLEDVEVESHILAHDPAQDDDDGGDEDGDLDGGANGDTDGQIDLVLHGDGDGSNVLCSVTDDGQDDKTDECLTDARRFDHGLDGITHEVGTDGDEASTDKQHEDGSLDGHLRAVVIVVIIISNRSLLEGSRRVGVIGTGL